MGAILVPLLVVLAIVVVLALGVRTWSSRRLHTSEQLAGPEAPTLDYHVPPGQDPVVVLSALTGDGFEATTDPADATLVHISCPAGLERARARARATIRSADATAIDHGAPANAHEVRFVDEG
jgi:hypothetical protein